MRTHAEEAVRSVRRWLADLLTAGPVANTFGSSDLSPRLEASIRKHALAPLGYRAGASAFRVDYLTTGARALVRAKQRGVLLAAWASEDVHAALLKGTAYETSLYADAALRPMDDMDLLLRAEDRPRAIAIALRLGYVVRGGDLERSSAPIHHAVTLNHPEWPYPLDLHRSMTGRYGNRLVMSDVWARACPSSDVPHALVLDPVDEMLFHLLHIARSGFVVRGIGYVDAARLLQRLTAAQRQMLRARAREFRIARSVDAALATIEMLANGDARQAKGTPWAWLPDANEIIASEPASLVKHHVRQALLSDSPVYAWGYVRSHLLMVNSPRKVIAWVRRVAARRRAA